MVSVSVIIPTYNRADLLEQAIRSVLAQTCTDYEIIVVDDGSTDDIQHVVMCVNDARVRYERLPHGGVSKARNHGIRTARGQYIAFLDSDDAFMPDKLQKQLAFFEQHPDVGMIYTGYTSVDEDLKMLREHPAPLYTDYRPMLTSCTIATPTVMVRRDVFERVGMFDETMHLAEDIDLWCRIFRLYPILPLHQSLTRVRLHKRSTPRDPEAVVNAYMHLLVKAFRADPKGIPRLERRRMLARIHYLCAHDVLAQVDPHSADPRKYQTYWYYYVKAARYYPFSRMALSVFWRYHTRGIRAVAKTGKRIVKSVKPRREIRALRADIAYLHQRIEHLSAEVEALKKSARPENGSIAVKAALDTRLSARTHEPSHEHDDAREPLVARE
jgi:glycosyltransferase involved in cell wall biosynthesis